ncbi:unnamed protein product [Rhizoctonia solani]|uniref:Uncharacterized protein n=1 Tax=Rhizoctonia solani TaxID=456999 RepID=A0A8H3D741_9AGAM|nr:unnamed protein product [Rhizoctonia solani]CAE7162424.1 unnamed protein product [Rhizoctonia solani]
MSHPLVVRFFFQHRCGLPTFLYTPDILVVELEGQRYIDIYTLIQDIKENVLNKVFLGDYHDECWLLEPVPSPRLLHQFYEGDWNETIRCRGLLTPAADEMLVKFTSSSERDLDSLYRASGRTGMDFHWRSNNL